MEPLSGPQIARARLPRVARSPKTHSRRSALRRASGVGCQRKPAIVPAPKSRSRSPGRSAATRVPTKTASRSAVEGGGDSRPSSAAAVAAARYTSSTGFLLRASLRPGHAHDQLSVIAGARVFPRTLRRWCLSLRKRRMNGKSSCDETLRELILERSSDSRAVQIAVSAHFGSAAAPPRCVNTNSSPKA